MRIEKASKQHFRNHNRTLMADNLRDFIASGSKGIHKILRLCPENTFQMLTEQMSGVYGIPNGGKEGIDGWRYDWKIKGVPDYTTTVVQSVPMDYNLGRNNQEFNICLFEEIANKNDVLLMENRQGLLVLENATFLSEGRYQYRVSLVSNDPTNQAFDPNFGQIGKRVAKGYNIQPELSREGYMQTRDNGERRVNFLTKFRVGIEYSGESVMQKYSIFDDEDRHGESPLLIIDQKEKLALEELARAREMAMLFGVSTVNPENGEVMKRDSMGHKMIAGDGIITQVEKDGVTKFYTRMTTALLRQIIMNVLDKNPHKNVSDINIVLMTGIEGLMEWDRAMRDELKTLTLVDSIFVNKSKEKINIGNNLTGTYTWLGATISVVRNPIFDNKTGIASTITATGRPEMSSTFLALDMSTYDGTPNVQLRTRNGANLIKGDTLGFGGKDGKTSGSFSTPVHSSRHDIVSYGMVVCHVPETCMILRKSFL